MPSKANTGVVGPDNAFTVDIQTQETIDLSIKYIGLKEVSNPVSLERDGIPTSNGLFSEEIFGRTVNERKNLFGYIDLHTKVIHPLIYENLTKIQQNIEKCCAGEGCWKITEKGDLVKCKDNDPDANPDNTGMDWFIKNYPKIKFKRNSSKERNERLDVLETFEPNEIFLTKFLVIPVFYRDIEVSNGVRKIPKINDAYVDLIRYSKSLTQNTMLLVSNAAKFRIQLKLLEIHKYFRSLWEKSHGFTSQYILGKSSDYGYRTVISCQVLDQYDLPSEVPIDLIHTGIPLSQCCVTLYPFLVKWISDYIQNQFVTNGNKLQVLKNGNVVVAELDDPMADYSAEDIRKRLDKYVDSFETRFEPVLVRCKAENGAVARLPLVFGGKPFDPLHPDFQSSTAISNRVFTWTDLIYIAAEDVARERATWITRYPVISYLNITPSLIHVMSTVHTIPVKLRVNGVEREYPHYPDIDPNASLEKISTLFNDTMNMDNGRIEVMGADYDGDQESDRTAYSEEAVEEIVNIIKSKKYYLNTQGRFLQTAGNELILCLYSWTQRNPKGVPASPQAVEEIINSNYKEVGVKQLTKWFGYRTDIKTKVIQKPKFRVYDTVKLPAGKFGNEKEVETTLGMLAFNLLCIHPYVQKVIPNGYWNTPLSRAGTSELMNLLATALKTDQITTDETWPWFKAIEFYGYKATTIFSSSFTEANIIPDKAVIAKRDKFFKDNPNPSLEDVAKLEDELSAMMKDKISTDTSATLWDSGAKVKVDDQLKIITSIVGPVYNPETGSYDVIKSNYMEGFAKEDIYKMGNMQVSASYPKSVGTADSGYITKQVYSSLGATSVDEDGTDCHTKAYLTLVYYDYNWQDLVGQNVMISDSQYVTVTEENYQQFINRPVKVRSPMCCTAEKCCSVCTGRRPYQMDMRNIGVTFATAPNTLVNAGMKKFHTSRVRLKEVNVHNLFI